MTMVSARATSATSATSTTRIGWLTELVRLSQCGSGGRQAAVDAMLRHVVHGFDGASGCLAIRDAGDAAAMRIAAAIDLPPEVIGQRIAAGEGVLGRVLVSGEAVLLNGDVRADSRFADVDTRADARRARSALCWPLTVDDQRIGVLSINRGAGLPPFDAVDLAEGEPVAALLALAVDNLRMHDDLRAQVDRLSAVNAALGAAHQRLAETQGQLLQSEKMASIGQLAAGVAHEINNPVGYVASNLATMQGYVQELFGLLDRVDAEPMFTGAVAASGVDLPFLREDVAALLGECREGLARVRKIVQDLKDFSRIDHGEAFADADLVACLDSALNIAANEIKYKAVVERQLAPLPPLPCNASQINQVLLNLLVNAAHAIERDGRIVLRSGHDPAAGDDGEAWIEVEDNGCGIDTAHLHRIFEPFFTTKPVGKGTGLGLSLSYSIVRKHSGRLEVRSQPGAGSCFRLVLPLRQPPEPHA